MQGQSWKRYDSRCRILNKKDEISIASGAGLLLNLGYNNFVQISRVIAILSPESSPMRRLRDESKKERLLIDATQGRKTRSIVVCDSNHVILSGLTPETLQSRFENPSRGEK